MRESTNSLVASRAAALEALSRAEVGEREAAEAHIVAEKFKVDMASTKAKVSFEV